MLRMFIKRALIWLAAALFVWLLLAVSFTLLFAMNPVMESAQPTEVTAEETEYLLAFVEMSETYFTCDLMAIKLEFYNATGLFSFLNSGNCWCPNRLLVRWCNDAL